VKTLLLWLLIGGSAFAEPQRIVSVGGAVTETLFALGVGDRVVGVDSSSTFPASATALPQVGYQRAIAPEGVVSLQPDLLVLAATAGPADVVSQLEGLRIPTVHLTEGYSLDAAGQRILRIGEAVGRVDESKRLVESMKTEASRAALPEKAPRVLFVLSAGGGSPVISGTGTAADAMIRLAGGTNPASDFTGYRSLSPEALVALDPEIVLTTKRTLAVSPSESVGLGKLLPGLDLTAAGRNSRLVVMDDLFLLGFGPRTGEAIAKLAGQFAGVK